MKVPLDRLFEFLTRPVGMFLNESGSFNTVSGEVKAHSQLVLLLSGHATIRGNLCGMNGFGEKHEKGGRRLSTKVNMGPALFKPRREAAGRRRLSGKFKFKGSEFINRDGREVTRRFRVCVLLGDYLNLAELSVLRGSNRLRAEAFEFIGAV